MERFKGDAFGRGIESESVANNADICRFAILVSSTSMRIEDSNYVQKVYRCLGEQSSCSENELKERQKRKHKLEIGKWVLIGVLSGAAVALVISIIIRSKQCREPSKSNSEPKSAAFEDVLLKGPSCPKVPIREVYTATNNLHESNFIGKDRVLFWIQRLEIAIDSSRGLFFLHTYPEGCIVHRDIKPTNILLGPNLEAKLSDFGLSKVIDLGEAYVSSEVRGTFGYLHPEYQNNRQVNSSGDVYSFGVVLLQILLGKKVINLNQKKLMPLDKMAKAVVRGGRIADFADPRFEGEYSAEAFNFTLQLAISCTGLKQQRPSMEQAVI